MSGTDGDSGGGSTVDPDDEPGLLAHRCPEGHLTYPGHPRCPECGREQTDVVDLADRTATVVTWTTSTATPPGVRAPNHLAVVEFEVEEFEVEEVDVEESDVDDATVRAIGQLTTGDVETGDAVRPVYVDELRDPDAGIRHPASQAWDGYRFEPV